MDRIVALIKVGSTRPQTIAALGDYEAWFQRALPTTQLGQLDLRDPGFPIPEDRLAGLIVMGSPHSTYQTDLPWYPRARDILKGLVDRGVPTLGVCFGHQMLADALGGEVSKNPRGYEAGTAALRLSSEADDDPLFSGLPPTFTANQSHGDTVSKLPPGARVLAANDHDPHQALRLGEKVWSVQFHPEIALHEARLIVEGHRDELEEQGHDVDGLIAAAEDTPIARGILQRFVDLARG